jgi:Ca2+-binding RTX toxin-like protein
MDGNDVLNGVGGADTISGGNGNDTMSLLDRFMDDHPHPEPRMPSVKQLSNNGSVGVLKPRCTRPAAASGPGRPNPDGGLARGYHRATDRQRRGTHGVRTSGPHSSPNGFAQPLRQTERGGDVPVSAVTGAPGRVRLSPSYFMVAFL